jgi:ribonuclease HI
LGVGAFLKTNMIVTINTDASYSHKHNKGAFAFWMVSNEGKICKSGLLKGDSLDPTHAEIKTISNALFHLSNFTGWSGISKVIINTDSMNSIHLLTKNDKAIKKYRINRKKYQREMQVFFTLVNKLKYNIEMRHVRSHVSTATAKQWVNEWCDNEAKKHLNKFLLENE